MKILVPNCVLFTKQIINYLEQHIPLIIILVVYITFEVMIVIPLPVIGIHAWNESVYLSFVNYMKKIGNPFLFNAAYDPIRPDYNVGYLFFWTSYVFHSIIQGFSTSSPENFLWFSRFFSLISTILSSLLIYVISIKLVKKAVCAYFNVALFLFSPLVLYFGTKFQLEPFTFLLFLLSWLFVIMHTENSKSRYIILSFGILGALILTRQIFAIYVPALLTYLLIRDKSNGQKSLRINTTLAILFLFLGFMLPLVITQLVVPEYPLIGFQYSRLVKSPSMAFSPPWQSGNLILLYIEKSLLPSLGLSFCFVIFLFILLPFLRKSNFRISYIVLIVFLVGGAVYFAFAFLHNIVHMYHNYYFLPPILLSSNIVVASILKTKRKCFVMGLTIFLIISSIFSIWETTNFYGICSDRIYRVIDAYGNLDSVFAGYLINKIYHISRDYGLLDNVIYYSLVQSPAVYFYAEMPSLSYYDFYEWNSSSKIYKQFKFFVDQESFLCALQKRNLFILTITPDVYAEQNESFRQYVSKNFVFLASEGVYTFYLNETLFNRAPAFYKNQALTALMEIESSQIAPAPLSQRIMNESKWYIISKKSTFFYNSIPNTYTKVFNINGQLSNKSITIEISLMTKSIIERELLVSVDDVINIRYGKSNDIYLEITSTNDGYRWISGVDISRFLWQNLTITFVYDVDVQRAEIYFNGVLLSNILRGVDQNSFSPVNLSENHTLRIMGNSAIAELYSIKLWNQSLSSDEIKNGKQTTDPIFSLQ